MMGEIKTTVPAEDTTRQVGSGFQVDTGASDITDEGKLCMKLITDMILPASSFSTKPVKFRNSPLTDFQHCP